jgi:hypothetical protein
MSANYFMSDAFNEAAAKSVREAISKADALGLPKAYSAAPELPQQPVIVRISGAAKKKVHSLLQDA